MPTTTSMPGLSSSLIALRGAVMVIAGLYAILFPGVTLASLVTLGGVLFLIDGILGLWALTFGRAKTGNFWFDIARNVLAIVAGVVILMNLLMATLFSVTFLVYFVGVQAVIVGVMELVMVARARQLFAQIWPVMVSGILYVLFGLGLLFEPLMGALALVTVAGVFGVIFGVSLLGLAWRLHKSGM